MTEPRRRSPARPVISPITIDSDSDESPPRPMQPPGHSRMHQTHPQGEAVPRQAIHTALLYDPSTEYAIADVVSAGLHFLNELRTNPKHGVDDKFRAMLKDPFPTFKKPVALTATEKVPQEIVNYFVALTCHVNKGMGVVYIWLDLYAHCDVYIPFSQICNIHIMVWREVTKSLYEGTSAPLFQQPPEIQRVYLDLMASARLLHNWAQTASGKNQISAMEVAVEKKRSSDDSTAQNMMDTLQYQSWLHYIEDSSKEHWLRRVDQRAQ